MGFENLASFWCFVVLNGVRKSGAVHRWDVFCSMEFAFNGAGKSGAVHREFGTCCVNGVRKSGAVHRKIGTRCVQWTLFLMVSENRALFTGNVGFLKTPNFSGGLWSQKIGRCAAGIWGF